MSGASLISELFFLFFPIVVTNVLHMFVVKKGLFSSLAIPVSRGLFGANKTYRGFVFASMVNAVLYALLLQEFTPQTFGVGALFGFVYMAAELPNSYLKRRLGIAAGASSRENYWLQLIADKSDSALGVCAVYSVVYGKPWAFFFASFFVAFLLHFSVSQLLVVTGVKRSL